MPIINLSDLSPDKMICPPELRRVELVDVGGLGLYCELRRSSPGVGTYYLRYKDANGKTCHQKIGSTAVISLADARARAKRLKAEITLGADPRADAKARKAVITYDEFFNEHYLPHVKMHKRSWARDEELYRLRIKKVFGGKRLNQISRTQVQLFQRALADEGLAAATVNHHQKVLRFSWNMARSLGLVDGENPASGVAMLPEENRVENYLDDQQLERLLAVLRTDRNHTVCRIALFLLSTGCRLNEVLSATWGDVEIERRVFTVRATNSKSRKLRSVPLNDSAIEVLNSLDRGEAEDPLFVSSRGKKRGATKPFTTIAKQWDRIRKVAELPHLRLHDLRHSFASFLVNDGRTLYEVQAILGHSTSKVTERYAHLSTTTLQAASASASAKLTGGTSKSTG